MEVHVRVERAAEPLDDHDGAAAPMLETLIACAIVEHAKDAADQHARDLAAQRVISGQLVPEAVRQTQHPLSDRHIRKTQSTRCAARSAIRRPAQLGHSVRPLQENGTSRSKPQSSQ
jgi:hypothetical protein